MTRLVESGECKLEHVGLRCASLTRSIIVAYLFVFKGCFGVGLLCFSRTSVRILR